jgi:antitoxin component YwqK of YwqJK toxin-antitoxin module
MKIKVKTFVIIFFLSAATTVLFAQNLQTVKTYYDPWTKIHLDEVYTINASTTAMHGSYKKYDENGIIYKEGYYKNSLKNGTFKQYFDCGAGVLTRITNYKDDVLDGLDESYYCLTDINGKSITKKKVSTVYVADKFIKETSYYKNGNIEHSLQINGLCSEFYENGQKKKEYTVTNEVYNGLFTSWFENGKINIQGNYSNGNGKYSKGMKIGKWLEYFIDGKLKSETINRYNDNGINSDLSYGKEYFENGNLKYQKDSIGNNRYKEIWYDNITSKTIKEKNYLYNQVSSTSYYYYADGKEILNYPSGNKKSEINYSANKKNGEYFEWFENGQINTNGKFINDNEIGTWVTYYETGKIKSQGDYKDNSMYGIWNYFNEDGTIEFVEEYKNGSLESKKSKVDIEKENSQKESLTNLKLIESKLKEINTLYIVSSHTDYSKPGLGEVVYTAKNKQKLFGAFLIIQRDINSKISNCENFSQKAKFTGELVKLLEKMIVYANSDTKEIEKLVKKETDPQKIKTIMGL